MKKQRKTRKPRTPKTVNVYEETKKILNSFLPFPPNDDLKAIGPNDIVAIDFGGIIKRTTAGRVAEAVREFNRIRNQSVVGNYEDIPKFEEGTDEFTNAKQWETPPSKELFDLPKSYSFELKPTDVFNITVDGRELNMSGQTLKECFDVRYTKEALEDAIETIKGHSDHRRFSVKPEDLVHIRADECTEIKIKGKEIIDAIAVKDQVENLRQEAQQLTDWKNSALTVLKKWEAVEEFIQRQGEAEVWGKTIAELVLERLKGNMKQFTGKEVKNMQVVNERERTPDELVKYFLDASQQHEQDYAQMLSHINGVLLERLKISAEKLTESSHIAQKRLAESLQVIQQFNTKTKL